MDSRLLAPCNIYCGNCAIYKKGECLGCEGETSKTKVEGRVFCDIFSCSRDKKLATCSDCEEYPCRKYDTGIFAESFIKWIKEKLKKQ